MRALVTGAGKRLGKAIALALADDEQARRAAYRKLDSTVHVDMPVLPLFHDQVTHILSNRVDGWQIHPVNRLDLRRVTKR